MAKRARKLIWTVKTSDENYPGRNETWLLEGASAAVVEVKALKKASQYETMPDEEPCKPYIQSIELVGELQG